MAMTFAQLVSAARQMQAALSANKESVATRGVTPEFLSNGQGYLARAEALNIEQERLKAELHTKTAELDAVTAQLTGWQSEAVSSVKLAYRTQPEKWLEFGISAKR